FFLGNPPRGGKPEHHLCGERLPDATRALQAWAHHHARIPSDLPADWVALGLFRHALTTTARTPQQALDKRQDAFYLVHLSAVCGRIVRTDSSSSRPNKAISNDNRPQL